MFFCFFFWLFVWWYHEFTFSLICMHISFCFFSLWFEALGTRISYCKNHCVSLIVLIFWWSKIVLGTGKNKLLRLQINSIALLHTHTHTPLINDLHPACGDTGNSLFSSLHSFCLKGSSSFHCFHLFLANEPLVQAPTQTNQLNGHLSSVKYHRSIVF